MTSEAAGCVDVVDVASLAVVARISTAARPRSVAFSVDGGGNTLYVHIVDPVAAITKVGKYADYVYRELQFGLRKAISAKTLDELLGDLLTWPDWALDVSPYSWVPHVPAEPWSWSSFLGLTAVALALCAAAWARFRHRDIG